MRRLRRRRPSAAAAAPGPTTPLERYEHQRTAVDRPGVCNAPWSNLYFSATGAVGPCWIRLDGDGERWSPERSILDIWRGPVFEAMRRELAARRFPGACGRCGADVEAGHRPLAAVYDDADHPTTEWPTALELELSNLCNLECVMCNGDLSSKIRRHREHRPPLEVPYDDTFVEQVTELIPHLHHLRFSGGEPTLHPIVHQICDRVVELRPDLRIDISTNGSTLNTKVRRLLERAKVQINVSFDSLRADRYESIRIGADFELLMANIAEMAELVRPHGGLVTVNTNPMRANWDEMPDFVRWCDERDFHLSFNTVLHPEEMSLRTLPPAELAVVVDALASAANRLAPVAPRSAAAWNHDQYRNLVEQVRGWHRDAVAGESGGPAAGAVPVAIAVRPADG